MLKNIIGFLKNLRDAISSAEQSLIFFFSFWKNNTK